MCLYFQILQMSGVETHLKKKKLKTVMGSFTSKNGSYKGRSKY